MIGELAARLTALERVVEQLRSEVAAARGSNRKWWRDDAGRFAGDVIFDEMVNLGRKYRKLQNSPKRGDREQ
jgi:muconolactone delta-isomerase